jgi:D-alanine-D-alanine ligase
MKKHVIVVCGGRSAEHEVSLISAASVLTHLDYSAFDVSVIGISKSGGTIPADQLSGQLSVGRPGLKIPEVDNWIVYLSGLDSAKNVVFPVLHGPYGEDGTIQGLLELLDLPYVGAGVGGSAVGMNKLLCKSILKAHGLPVLPAVDFNAEDWDRDDASIKNRILNEIGFPLFVKPANMGSSIGISRCLDLLQTESAIQKALRYDDIILVEKGVDAREIEVSVLGGFNPRSSRPGEIVPSDEFYSYKAKYLDGSSQLIVPAQLSSHQEERIREMACSVFQALQLEGMARIDFLLERESGQVWVNEPNTIPGFTPISMYPKLWDASGLTYPELLKELIHLGVQRHLRRSKLSVDR